MALAAAYKFNTLYGGGAHLEEEGHIYYPSFAHQERRTCQIRMRSDA
jgi:hypothetical protein